MTWRDGLPPRTAGPCWLLLAPLREAVLAGYVSDDDGACWREAADWAATDLREPIAGDAIVAWQPATIPKEAQRCVC